MAINSNQLHVAKIYPGNYTNVLRYWHETKTIQYQNANGVDTNLTGQPVGGPVGVVFQPGWIAQQAVGYVDMMSGLISPMASKSLLPLTFIALPCA